jgi:sugar phosphate isomerase/epimerase
MNAAALTGAARLSAQEAPKSLLRTGLVAYSFRKQFEAKAMTYEKLIRMASDLGLDGLDTTVYWFPDTSDQFLANYRATAYKHAISLPGIAVRVELCQPTPERQQAELEKVRTWVNVAEKLGAGHIRVFGGSAPKGATIEQAMGWAVEVVKRAADIAAPKGVVLGVENDYGITTDAEPTIEIVRRAASPFVGLNVDTGNFKKDGYAETAACLPYASNVHIKGSIVAAGGRKEKADWDRLAAMFAKGGYRGYLSLEYEDEEDPFTAIPRLSVELKRVARKYSV